MDEVNTIPSLSDLQNAYALLLPPYKKNVPIRKLIKLIYFSRFDPRLAEIIVVYFSHQWKSYPPFEIQEELSKRNLDSTFGVLLEFSESMLAKSRPALFESWKKLVLHQGKKKGGNEQFFIGVWPLASARMLEMAEFSTREYERWGFLGGANLCPKSMRMNFSPATRKRILTSLLKTKKDISAKEYWLAIGRCVSLRQAERDLLNQEKVSARGYTRNRRYRLHG